MCQSTDYDLDEEFLVDEPPYRGRARFVPDPYVRLAAARREHLDAALQRVLAAGRTPRVCLYSPPHLADRAQAYAVERHWQVVGHYTDPDGIPDPQARPGWSGLRMHLAAGYADGALAYSPAAISPAAAVYERQLTWFHARGLFVALVTPAREPGRCR
ncbi:hypothetical protein [Streptomyces sp. DH12]|uniref:hypothetical protein n=1 Tax=Streptomyces sp. DH12 TaxID=2857010 RepID=UPI001E401C32|nr:hypothetical protein [Streptomyces sp. DH12]